jgi:hypothetical protein
MKNSSALSAAAVVVAAVGIMATLPASPLLAQVRAALVRDVDQPARQSVTVRKFTRESVFETVYTVPAINVSGAMLVADGATIIDFEPGAALNLRIFVSEATTCTLSGHTVDLVA